MIFGWLREKSPEEKFRQELIRSLKQAGPDWEFCQDFRTQTLQNRRVGVWLRWIGPGLLSVRRSLDREVREIGSNHCLCLVPTKVVARCCRKIAEEADAQYWRRWECNRKDHLNDFLKDFEGF